MSRGTLDPAAPYRLRLRGFHPLWQAFPGPFGCPFGSLYAVRTPTCTHVGLGFSGFARRYFRNRFSFFSSGYLDVSVRRVPSICLWIQHMVTEVYSAGFPHSDTCGSMPICGSPQLFAAYRVFHRPLVPRHPPRALFCLTVCCLTFSRIQTSFLSCLAWHYLAFLLFSSFSFHSAVRISCDIL